MSKHACAPVRREQNTIQVGRELVTYETAYCSCGTVMSHAIINRISMN
jgi:hypothetical protein